MCKVPVIYKVVELQKYWTVNKVLYTKLKTKIKIREKPPKNAFNLNQKENKINLVYHILQMLRFDYTYL